MRSIKNIAYTLTIQIVNYVFPLVSIPIVSRALGPSNLGVVSFITSFVLYFSLLINYGFSYTGVRRLASNPSNKDCVFSNIFFAQFFLFILSSIFFFIFINTIHIFKENIYLCVVLYTSCLASLFTQNWFLQYYSQFKILAVFSFFTKMISFFAVVFFIKNNSDTLFYCCIINFTNLFTSMIVFLYTIIKFNLKVRFYGFHALISYLLEDRMIFFSSIVTTFYTSAGLLILGFLCSNADVGYYSSSQKVLDVLRSVILLPVTQVVFPLLAKKFKDDIITGINSVKKILPSFIIISLFTFIFINLFARYIIIFLFGSGFEPSVNILHILSFGMAGVFIGAITGGQVMLNLNMDKQFLLIQVFISIFSLILNFIFVQHNGAISTAIIWSISEVIITFSQVFYLKYKGYSLLSKESFRLTSLINSLFFISKR